MTDYKNTHIGNDWEYELEVLWDNIHSHGIIYNKSWTLS